MNEQIPIGCAINIAIINSISQNETFLNACIDVPRKMNLIPESKGIVWPFFNVSWSAYMLYSFFVVPKEIYSLQDNDPFYKSLVANNLLRTFVISKQKKSFTDDPAYHLRSLRNSISHVNYDATVHGIRFWDHAKDKQEQADWHWEVEIASKDLPEFFIKISEANFKFYDEIKFGKRKNNGQLI